MRRPSSTLLAYRSSSARLAPWCAIGFAALFTLGCVGASATKPAGPRCAAAGDAAPIVDATAEALRPRATSGVPSEIVYDGTLTMEGHYRRPGETRPFRSSWTVVTFGDALTRLDFTTWEGDDKSKGSVETTWFVGDAIVRRDDGGEPYRALEGLEARQAREIVDAVLPSRWPGRCASTLSRVDRPYGHPRLGDVNDRVDYGRPVSRAGFRLPETIALRQHRRDESFQVDMRLQSAEAARGDAGALVASAREAVAQAGGASAAASGAGAAASGAGSAAGLGVNEIGRGVFEIVPEEGDVRGLVVEFASYVVAIEAPLTSELGERFVDAIGARFPSKPIRHVLFSHYHPHYTGGLRAFVAAGAQIVTTQGNAGLASETARRPFTRAPDRLARSPVPARVEAFRGSWVLDDGTNRLEAYDIGEASAHTDEYVVFYLPGAGLLFEGDLGFFAAPDGLRAGRRAKGLLEAIEAKGLRVERLVQGWPVKGSPGSIGFAEWKALVRAREASR